MRQTTSLHSPFRQLYRKAKGAAPPSSFLRPGRYSHTGRPEQSVVQEISWAKNLEYIAFGHVRARLLGYGFMEFGVKGLPHWINFLQAVLRQHPA
jgi:hypothetical protein